MIVSNFLKFLFIYLLLLLGLGLFAQKNASAAIDPVVFTDAKEEARYKNLIDQLRCLVCQNQNLSDSNAELAQDLRREVSDMIKAGKTDREIIDFLVARYSDFVLYRPPVNAATFLLWFLPGILAILALFIVIGIIKKRSSQNKKVTLDENAEDRLNKLIGPKK